MTTAPLLSGSLFNGNIARVRNSHATIRECLRRLSDEPEPGPQTRLALINKMTMALYDAATATTEMEKIGLNAKAARKAEQQ